MQFYVLRQPKPDSPEDRLGRSTAIKEEGSNFGDCVECPSCHSPLSMLKWLPPYRIELESWGKHYGDVADIGDDLIVSGRFVEVFTNSGLKGLTGFEPIEVIKVIHRRGRPKEPLPRYFKANVVRSATTIDQEASGFVWADKSKVCPVCLFDDLKRYRCLIVKEESLTGDDVFFPHGGKDRASAHLVTSPVRIWIRKLSFQPHSRRFPAMLSRPGCCLRSESANLFNQAKFSRIC